MPILKYGRYAHGLNEVKISITGQALKTEGGIYYATDYLWSMEAFPGLQFATQSLWAASVVTLTNAYSVDGYDLVLYLDDGVTSTGHALISASCNGGTRVIQAPSFPQGSGAEGSTYRSYAITVAGEVPVLPGVNVYTKFHETISFEGTGGPVVVYVPVAQGAWIEQQTAERSTFRVIQSGSAEGLYGRPFPPPPIWPSNEKQQLRRITPDSPRMRNGQYYNFPISWSYTFESNGSLDGQPNQYPQ